MVEVFGAIAAGIASNLISDIINNKLIDAKEKKTIQTIYTMVADFNRDFDNSELDTNSFEKFIKEKEIADKLFNRLFGYHKIEPCSIEEFTRNMANEAIIYINDNHQSIGKSNINDEENVLDYFNNLILCITKIRDNVIGLKESIELTIIKNEIHNAKDELIYEIRNRDDNAFAEDKIEELKSAISLHKYEVAGELIEDLQEEFEQLSKSQKEVVYYQRARILINQDTNIGLDKIRRKIEKINPISRFIYEIDFYIMCDIKNQTSFNIVMEGFKKNKYSTEKLLLKEVEYKIHSDDLEGAKELLLYQNSLKPELVDFNETHYYYGIILLKNNEFDRALIEFEKAYSIYENIIYKYKSLISRFMLIGKDSDGKLSRVDGFIIKVKSLIDEFVNIKYIINKFSDEEVVNYWSFVINLYNIVDARKAFDELENIDNKYKDNNIIRSLYAENYMLREENEKATPILEELYDFIHVNTIKLFIIYTENGDWKKIIEKYSKLEGKEFTDNPLILSLLYRAECKVYGYGIFSKKLIQILKKYQGFYPIVKTLILISIEYNDLEIFDEIIKIVRLNMKNYHVVEISHLGYILLENNRQETVKELLVDYLHESEDIFKRYSNAFEIEKTLKEGSRELYAKVRELYNNGIRYKSLLQLKVYLDEELENWRVALNVLNEYLKLFGLDYFYAINFVDVKMKKNELDIPQNIITYLKNQNEPFALVIIAFLFAKQSYWEQAKELALDALFLCKDNPSREIFRNMVSLLVSNTEKEKSEDALTTIRNNTVVYLQNGNENRIIAIHKNNVRTSGSDKLIFECENIYCEDPESLILISTAILGETVELLDGVYKVVGIADLFGYFFRYSLNKLGTDYPPNEDIKLFYSSTIEKQIEEMKEVMIADKARKDKMIKNYNFGVHTGLPVSCLSGKDADDYGQMIMNLLNKENQHFYSGVVTIFKENEYVFSLSSLIILSNLGLLDRLGEAYNKSYISSEIIRAIDNGIKKSNNQTQVSSGVMLLNDNNDLVMYEYSEEEKMKWRKFWTKLRISVNKFTELSVNIETNELYDIASIWVDEFDIASIELARQTNRVLVSDDSFIRNMSISENHKIKNTNTVGFLVSEGLLTDMELFDIVLKLSKQKYLFVTNGEILFRMYSWLSNQDDDVLKEEYMLKFKEIYKNMFDDISGNHYINIHRDFLKLIQVNRMHLQLLFEIMKEPFKLNLDSFVLGTKGKGEIILQNIVKE